LNIGLITLIQAAVVNKNLYFLLDENARSCIPRHYWRTYWI